jgi:hypothetical protein
MRAGTVRNPHADRRQPMDFTPGDAIAAAQRILHSPGALVGAAAPTAQAPSRAVVRPAATIRTLGPTDPPPFDRTYPSLFARVARPLLVLAILALIVAAGLHK